MKRINLLPKPKRTELMYERLYHNLIVAIVLAVCILLSGVVSQLLVWGYLENAQATLSSEIEILKSQINKTENAELKQQIRFVNNQMKDFENLSISQPQWSKVLNAFAADIPDGVKISQFNADSKLKVDITGFSPTREGVIELYNNIKNDTDHFKDIDYPLENISKPTDVRFHFSFTIQSGILIPKP